MKNRIFYFIIFIILTFCILSFFYKDSVSEKVYDWSVFSGDSFSDSKHEYDIWVEDDMITFYDENGNSIMYVFENDRLKNVFNVYNARNEVEAKKIAAYFMNQVGSGEILDVNFLDTTVSVQMDMDFFSDYKDYTKKQIEDILLNNTNLVSGEE